MSGLFGGKAPKMPVPVVPPPAPSIDEASASRDAGDRASRRKGRAAAIFAGGSKSGASGAASATKTLTGG
jgi:hypothetical protein